MRQAYRSFACCLVIAAPLALAAGSWGQEVPPPAEEEMELAGTEVLTRGPIHEAFAEPLTEPQPTMIVPKPPPEDVQEIPPEYALEMEGAIWIHGYWAWDDERDDFIWISGVQRVPPPGMRWVAGYWSEVEGGWQWTPGFWAEAEVEELSYHDTPPESLEEGPSSPAPGEEYFWVPGNWVYQDVDFHWTPGYWAVHRPDWVWVPARWVWTPRGCIYLPGRWDFLYARRGCLYAPIYFHQPLYARPGFFYRPWHALNIGNLFVHFWVRPNYCHYYFGNYYGNYDRWGLSPWHVWGTRRFGYDPMLSWYRVHYRNRGINYVDRIAGWHRYYQRHENFRPPITWAGQRRLANQVNITNITEINKVTNVVVRQNFLTARVDHLARMENAPVRLQRLDATRQREVEQRARRVTQEITDLRQQRRQVERAVARADRPERGPDAAGKARPDLAGRGRTVADVAGGTRDGQRPRLRLPRSEVAAMQPRVEVPERPDRGPPGDRGRPDRAPGDRNAEARSPRAGTTVERDALPDRAEGSKRGAGLDRTARPDRPDRAAGPNRLDRADTPGRADEGRIERPGIGGPDRGDRGPERLDRLDAPRSGERPPRPGPGVGSPEGGRPDRGPRGLPGPSREGGSERRGKAGAPRSSQRPEIEVPNLDRTEPRIERSEPRIERPSPRIERPEPRIERPEPRIERPTPRIERPEPRIERPSPRIERPTPRIDRPEPRVERPTPRIERSSSRIERPTPRINQPQRVERSPPEVRIERSRPEPRAQRGSSSRSERSNRGRGKDRD